MKKHLLFLSFLWFLSSCMSKLNPSKENKNSEKITEYSEDLSVFRPKYETPQSANVEKTELPKTQTASDKATSPLKNENDAVEAMLVHIKETNKKLAEGKGYRIQVFSGNNKADFESAKSYLYRNFSELELYESYSQPTYKIKVGDFVSMDEAAKYQTNLKTKFSTVRIISDKINIKKALEIK
jgi:SPOR domain